MSLFLYFNALTAHAMVQRWGQYFIYIFQLKKKLNLLFWKNALNSKLINKKYIYFK